jgi:chromosome segregation ATPase
MTNVKSAFQEKESNYSAEIDSLNQKLEEISKALTEEEENRKQTIQQLKIEQETVGQFKQTVASLEEKLSLAEQQIKDTVADKDEKLQALSDELLSLKSDFERTSSELSLANEREQSVRQSHAEVKSLLEQLQEEFSTFRFADKRCLFFSLHSLQRIYYITSQRA